MVCAAPGSVSMNDRFEAKVYFLTEAEGGKNKPFMTGNQLRMFSRTFDLVLRLEFKDKEMILPGEDFLSEAYVSIVFDNNFFSSHSFTYYFFFFTAF